MVSETKRKYYQSHLKERRAYILKNKRKIRDYERTYRKGEKRMEYQRQYSRKYSKLPKARATTSVRLKRYHKNPVFKMKYLARQTARKYIPAIECLLCGSKERLERHHPDYSKPLEVMILCQTCHRKVERGE
jgi:hypothetical protein